MFSKETINKLFYFTCIISCLVSIFLTSRFSYTWITDPDSANSPIMWKEFLAHGFNAFNNWKPTFDNWYFTVYPINFLLFFIFNENGFVPLMLSSAIFIIAICLCSSKIADILSGKTAAFAALISITLISPDLYSNYYSHPFSHNSTNAFGFVVLAIYIITLSSKKIIPAASIFILLVLSGASDPWILPSFTLPILISEVYNSFINRKSYKYFIFLLLAFLTSYLNLVQHLFDLPTGITFKGQEAAYLKGLKNYLQSTQQAAKAAVTTPTGQQTIPFIIGYGTAMNPATTGAAVSYGLLTRAYESEPFRNAMLRMANTPRGSTAFEKAMQQAQKAINALTQGAKSDALSE